MKKHCQARDFYLDLNFDRKFPFFVILSHSPSRAIFALAFIFTTVLAQFTKRHLVTGAMGSTTSRWSPGVQPSPSKARPVYFCPGCNRQYSWRQSMLLHYKNACGKEPQFQCPHCPYRAKQKGNLDKHVEIKHSAHTLTIL